MSRFEYYLEAVQQEKYILYIHNQESLNEMDLHDLKKGFNKLASTALLLSMPFLPIAKNLYGQSSCSIDSAGETVSCNADKLKAQRSTSDLLGVIKSGIGIIQKNIKDPDFKEFVPDELKLAQKGLQDLLKRKNITEAEKTDIQKQLQVINNLQRQI